jgi:hypothetical protein
MPRPSKAAAPFATPEPTFCAVCQNPAVWLGYAPVDSRRLIHLGPVIWLCGSARCHRAASALYYQDEPTEKLPGIPTRIV